jgi:Recombination endonuclease VII
VTLNTREPCGEWMPRAKTTCARKPLHQGEHRSAKALVDRKERKTARRLAVRSPRGKPNPEARSRWRRKHLLSRYGISQTQFDWLLKAQDHACAMCHRAFGEGVIFIDHDHHCCDTEKSSCGKCIRGLLCLSCNTALGHIERKSELARVLLAAPPVRPVA